MKRTSIFPMLAMTGLLLVATPGIAQETISSSRDIPRIITYQGLVTTASGDPIVDGNHPITVTLYGDREGTEKVWQGSYTASLRSGVFDIRLGSGEYPLPEAATLDRPIWVGVAIDGGDEMRPLTPLSASPYTLNVADNAITAEKIAIGAVTADKIGADYVSEIRINGEKITGKGTGLNIQAGDDIQLSYDRSTGNLKIGSAGASETEGKHGAGTLGSATDGWGMRGDGIAPGTHTAVAPTNNDWIGTSLVTPPATEVNFTIKVNGQRIMLYQPYGTSTPSIVGGNSGNTIVTGAIGSVIAGGGDTKINEIKTSNSFIGGGLGNLVDVFGTEGVIGGGEDNRVNGDHNAIVGGKRNRIMSPTTSSFIGGGDTNYIAGSAEYSSIVGGSLNRVEASHSSIVGGTGNFIDDGDDSFIGAGNGNSMDYPARTAVIVGGTNNKMETEVNNGFIGAGINNRIGNHSVNSVIGGGQNNQIYGLTDPDHCTVIAGTIAGGADNIVAAYDQCGTGYSTVGGGQRNWALKEYATVSGGYMNHVGSLTLGEDGWFGTIGGGDQNTVSGRTGTVAGGQNGMASGDLAAIGGGRDNIASAIATTIAGGDGNEASMGWATVGGGEDNHATSTYSTVGGGSANYATADHATVGGGGANQSTASYTTVGGGTTNEATFAYATVGGGQENKAHAVSATVGGGSANQAIANYTTVGGGQGNKATISWAVVGGGQNNAASGNTSTIGGGVLNTAAGTYSGILAGHGNYIGSQGGIVGGGYDNKIYVGYGSILGGQSNTINATADNSTIGGGIFHTIDAQSAAIGGGEVNKILVGGWSAVVPGGDNLTAQSYAQTVLGYYNAPRGSMPRRPSAGATAASNDPLVIVGNGDAVGSRSNAFEVSYNGHSTVYDINGPTFGGGRDPIRGATYSDNVLYAWGHITPGGGIGSGSEFGVSGVVMIGPGVYRVAINVVDPVTGAQIQLTQGSVTATLVDEGADEEPIKCASITVMPIKQDPQNPANLNTFVVKTGVFMPGGECEPVELPFMFKVTGRP